MVSVPMGMLEIHFLENVNKLQNLFLRPVATTVFLFSTTGSLWLRLLEQHYLLINSKL
ncbi:hypothetical protein AMTRI_Chr12g241870 [Amborella trichopoda]